MPPMSKVAFVDKSTVCAICLDALEEDEETKGQLQRHRQRQRPVIKLRCGHKWHLECIVEQIKTGSMTASNDDKRLLFNGCQCPKCMSIFGEDDHPDLPKDLIRKTDKLRSKVNALIDEHNLLNEDLLRTCKVQQNQNRNHQQQQREALYEEARRKYAFYLCEHCKDPYFGGTIDCADGVRPSSLSSSTNEVTDQPETRLCPACAPQSQTVCQNPSEHGPYLVWKCRYCCKPSTIVCYGNVHFCEDCHRKNSSGGRASLKAIPCPGDSCPYPKPTQRSREHDNHRASLCHRNGSTQDCEQVYSCVLCDSIGNGNGHGNGNHDPLAIEAGSRNFLVNPNGENGLEGWRRLNSMSWSVEGRGNQIIPPLLQTPVLGRTNEDGTDQRPPITTNFVSSFQTCSMVQFVDLREVLRLAPDTGSDNGVVRIEVSARYTGRTDCPSVFALRAILSDGHPIARRRQRNNNSNLKLSDPPAQTLSSGTLDAPPGVYWERTSLELSFDAKTHGRKWDRPMVTVIVFGKDKRFWRGNYGSKVADITVRVVGATPEEIDALVKPPSGG